MCKVLIDSKNCNEAAIGFVIYNFIFSHMRYEFTLDQLREELMALGFEMDKNILKRKVEEYIMDLSLIHI